MLNENMDKKVPEADDMDKKVPEADDIDKEVPEANDLEKEVPGSGDVLPQIEKEKKSRKRLVWGLLAGAAVILLFYVGLTSKWVKIERAARWMIKLAEDDSHGYDQTYRWGETGDYDCSSAIISAWEAAGVPVMQHGATYTGNFYNVFIACGFEDVTLQIDRSSGDGLERGDVLLNTVSHTAMYIGDGQEAEAFANEYGTSTGGVPGDQTGEEILIMPYRDYPWNYVLRYTHSAV